MAGETIELEHMLSSDHVATEIADRWREWSNLREQKVEEWKELRNYLYATDTRTTKNAMLPWSNSTTTPKLTQIMDNLHANYFATLFPQRKWFRFEASTSEDNVKRKRDTIQGYLENKVNQSDFVNTASDLLYDYITYGNCFATVTWEENYTYLEEQGLTPNYIGPKVVRISPFDICFNPTASAFEKTPKIIRSIKTLGEIKRMADTDENIEKAFGKLMRGRAAVRGSDATFAKSDGYIADGFTSIQQYYESDYVEILTFYGDIYDRDEDKYHTSRVITVFDRAYVVSNEPEESWLGRSAIFHSGWRHRPDNLYAMGPLDNLVGMQYRIDHLENMKADVWDQIAYPVRRIRGEVDDFEWYPGCEIYVGDDGDVDYLVPDATAMNAETQIERLMFYMEEMAGAPKQAMGFRTPGEKTAFEVSSLENAANRIFNHKTAHFERVFLEPILNAMLEVGRRNLVTSDEIFIEDTDNLNFFETITKEDLSGKGKIIPFGARSFAEKSTRIQNLSNLIQLKVTDPSIGVHISGKQIAKMLAEELGERELFSENVIINETAETASAQEEAEVNMEERRAVAEERGI